MICHRRRLILFTTLLLLLAEALVPAQRRGKSTPPEILDPIFVKKDIYTEDADSGSDIKAALKNAVTENKRVLLIFGANWCYDCHVLEQALHQGTAGSIVASSYLLVHVDIGEGDKNGDLADRYRIPLQQQGVPAVVVLRADGHVLYRSGDGQFGTARRMTKKHLVAFLNHWKVPVTHGQ
jgi:thiol:disulfide interchange protein